MCLHYTYPNNVVTNLSSCAIIETSNRYPNIKKKLTTSLSKCVVTFLVARLSTKKN